MRSHIVGFTRPIMHDANYRPGMWRSYTWLPWRDFSLIDQIVPDRDEASVIELADMSGEQSTVWTHERWYLYDQASYLERAAFHALVVVEYSGSIVATICGEACEVASVWQNLILTTLDQRGTINP